MDWVAFLMNVTSMTTLLSLSNLISSSFSFREKNKALRRRGRRASERATVEARRNLNDDRGRDSPLLLDF
jgi:hypothetical protein